MQASDVIIRRLATLEEYQAVEEIEREAWAMTDPRDYVPLHVLITAQKNGGLVAGAFEPSGRLIGFTFGFLGMTADGRFKHCSHMTAVLPSAQKREIGYRLKLFQRDEVLRQGLELITWTYDPLQRPNARLNVAKLGAIARTYYHNLYGAMSSGINAGLSSDRFEAEWWLKSAPVVARLEGQYAQPRLADLLARDVPFALQGVQMADGYAPQRFTYDEMHDAYLVEIPHDFNALKRQSIILAKAWRHESAQVFSGLFKRGYVLHDFLSETEDKRQRAIYLLTRGRTDLFG
jgi:predicted GNAT superfamily acetyltransferase